MNRCAENMRAIARAQDDWVESSGIATRVRQRLFTLKAPVPWHVRLRPLVWSAAACGALALGFGMVRVWHPGHRALNFSVGAAAVHTEPGEWLSAPTEGALPLSFSDGTQIVLRRSAQARVTRLTAQGAHVVLERGGLSASVVHQSSPTWQVQAGPFAVLVQGTRFDLEWSPEESALLLEMTEGIVSVVGPGIEGARLVKGGQTFRAVAEPRGWRIESADNGRAAVRSAPTVVDTPEPSTAAQTPTLGEAPTTSSPNEPKLAKPSWHELAAAGQYAESLQAARKYGLQRICGSGSAGELAKLAQVARLAGDAEAARTALRSVRERFAGTPEAAMATFDLGRLVFDSSGRFLEAAHWFKDYLREFPHGKLAREATGRLIEALDRGGDHSGAREVANEYLLKYPTGPHAGLARRLLER